MTSIDPLDAKSFLHQLHLEEKNYNSKTNYDLINNYYTDFDKKVMNVKLYKIDIQGKKEFYIGNKCVCCTAQTTDTVEITDNKFISETKYEETYEFQNLKVPFCNKCRNEIINYNFSIDKNQIKLLKKKQYKILYLLF